MTESKPKNLDESSASNAQQGDDAKAESEGQAKSKGTGSSLVRMVDQPPSLLPTVVLEDLVPFPGPVAPILLDVQARRDAVLHAKATNGFFLLVNRRGVSSSAPVTVESEIVVLEDADDDSVSVLLPSDDGDDDGSSDMLQEATLVLDAHGRVGAAVEIDAAELEDAMRGTDVDDDDGADQGDHDDRAEAAIAGESGEDANGADGSEYSPGQPVTLHDLCPVGILARLIKVVRLPDDRISALCHLIRRAQPVELLRTEPFPAARVLYPAELVSNEKEFQALFRQVKAHLKAFFDVHPSASDELKMAAVSIEVPGVLADFVAQHLSRDFEERLGFLAELDITRRMRRALEVVLRELDLLSIGNRITQEIREKVEKHQREFFLREQMKAIRAELGEEKDPMALAVSELEEKLSKAGLPEAVRERVDDEIKRMQLLPSESPEQNVIRSYLEWIANLPWSNVSEDSNDVVAARKVLDEDHYGLEEVKDRIIEFLAVRQLNPENKGSILCFAGPPGVGKTSLGQSIARALGRKFYRFSVGGMRDEAEIKGHRRTYVGAMPGRLLQGLKVVQTANPVFMLDELDKIGKDWRGDPSSALLEVLDPAQNSAFLDHYLDLPFDLSRVMFIATANIQTEIPDALRDRLEIIDLAGYIPEEKLQIASRYLLPRQRKEHGLTSGQLQVGVASLKRVIREYTHEAGVRNLERQLAKVCRKRAAEQVSKKTYRKSVTVEDVPTYLGPPKTHDEDLAKRLKPGVCIGLAWTSVGGELLLIEAARMLGKGQVKATGQLGDVMNESTSLAFSYVRTLAARFGIDNDIFEKRDYHMHFPAGAVPKDGPSAGVTVTTALLSLLLGRSVLPRVAMTGEITLRGEVLPVGGIREKVVAARRGGMRTVIVPERNRADVEEIPAEVRERLTFVYAATYDQVFKAAFGEDLEKLGPDLAPKDKAAATAVTPAKKAARIKSTATKSPVKKTSKKAAKRSTKRKATSTNKPTARRRSTSTSSSKRRKAS